MKRSLSTAAIGLALLLVPAPGQSQTQIPIPASETTAREVLESSPRHGEFQVIAVPQTGQQVKAWVTYPEQAEKAPVVIVIHEIYGLSDWILAVADRLAAEGFIAVAPDLLSGRGPEGGGTESFAGRREVAAAVRELAPENVTAALNAVRDHTTGLPAANGQSACMGFCWGGSTSFRYATEQPGLSAAIVYYGSSPAETADYEGIRVPVLGNFGGDDARVNATIPRAEEAMRALGRPFEPHIYEGAGHGFLRQQDGREGANLRASKEAWARTIAFLREHFGGR
jgi:carboxymethylenebutenolidase